MTLLFAAMPYHLRAPRGCVRVGPLRRAPYNAMNAKDTVTLFRALDVANNVSSLNVLPDRHSLRHLCHYLMPRAVTRVCDAKASYRGASLANQRQTRAWRHIAQRSDVKTPAPRAARHARSTSP